MKSLAAIIGNLFEHYDKALFGLLAPFIAPLFFAQENDPVTALILTYCMIPLGLLTRPLGSLFFGWMADRFGPKRSLFWSLISMAFITIGIGFLPTYRNIGFWSPLLLAIGRMMQNFCAAGESTGGAIYVLEQTESSKRSLVSSLYDASSIGGVIIASAGVGFMSSYGLVDEHWRYLFYFGGITAFFGVFLRFFARETHKSDPKKIPWLQALKEHRRAFLSIMIASGFSYSVYSLSFTLMNGLVPLVTSVSKSQVMNMNTLFLIIDMLLLPCFGYLSNKWGKEKVMLTGALCSALGAVPLFFMLDQASFEIVLAVRFLLLLFGVAFAAPYYAWAMQQVPSAHRYLILSFGCAIGSQLIGMPTSAICLWLYHTFNWSAAPGFYLMAVALAASWMIYRPLRIAKRESV